MGYAEMALDVLLFCGIIFLASFIAVKGWLAGNRYPSSVICLVIATTIKNRMREWLNERDSINVPAEEKGRDKDVSLTKTQSRQAFPTVNQTPEGRLPP